MKKVNILALLIVFGSFSCSTRHNWDDHWPRFRGEFIDGAKEEYIDKLIDQGYKVTSDSGYVVTLDDTVGETIQVSYTSKSRRVYDMDVAFPKRESYAKLEEDFESWLPMLRQNYGIAESVIRPNSTSNLYADEWRINDSFLIQLYIEPVLGRTHIHFHILLYDKLSEKESGSVKEMNKMIDYAIEKPLKDRPEFDGVGDSMRDCVNTQLANGYKALT
jgi:hypothetical protein